ncbi:MAG TPA: PKD domain-containing protein [Fulvivirga sp.]|nr:PKD domain-containing protein [Fulvivirga sp.]
MINQLICTIYLLVVTTSISAQCTDANFEVNESVCTNQNLTINNTSFQGVKYSWDFCGGDLFETPAVDPILSNNVIFRNRTLKIKFDGSNWYGFTIDNFLNKILKLNFGESLSNTPAITDLGNPQNLLNSALGMEIIMEQGEWYALVTNSGSNQLIKYSFGTSLDNTPVAESLGDFSILDSPNGLKFFKRESGNLLFVTNGGTSEILVFTLNSILDSEINLVNSFLVPGASNIRSLDLIRECDKTVGIVSSFSNNKIFLLNFENGIIEDPTLNLITFAGTLFFPTSVFLAVDLDNYFAIIQSSVGPLYRLNFGKSISDNSGSGGSLGNLISSSDNSGADWIHVESQWLGFVIDFNQKRLVEYNFPNTCPASQPISDESEPSLSYSQTGDYYITLKSTDALGNTSYHVDTVTVTSDIAPPITFTTQNVCQSAPIQFTSESSSGGLTYAWNFGDTNTSTDPNPSHTYATAGDYEVTLEVQDGTCSNFVKQNITVYEEPVPDFNIPGGNICTNQPYSFINTTPDNFDELLSYEWQLDGMSIATTRDLDFEFTSGGTKELKLITSIPGCSVEIAKSLLNIKEGTLPQFSFDDNCMGQTVQFTNNSVGTFTDIDWDFGNGFTSTLENPALEFVSDGTYDVTLTLTNADGCVTNATTPITIHPLPSVGFSNELACENLGTQFTDLSSVTLDNLAAWEWQFNDGTPISNEQNPQHEFGNFGDFNVKLVTTSTFGCKDSTEQVVNVLEAPVADFSLDKVCIDVPLQFTDESTPVNGESITNWSWSLGGTFSSEQNPTLVLSNALDYDISLTVTSQNLCISTNSKTITIPPQPTVLFDIENDCANEVATFLDVTDITGDNITQREWLLDNESLGNGTTLDHQFSGANDYNVTLEIETENGCSYSSVQTITINPVPVAAFSTSFTFGAPPFIIDFTNNSQGATAYNWTFEENEFSTDPNPTHTFNDQGSFDVQLVAVNEFNCTDSTVHRIEVLDPLLDIQLLNFSIVPLPESDMLSITVRNNGTIRLDSLDVVINLGGKLDVHEVIQSGLNPEETITAQLELKVNNRKLDYICISVSSFLTNTEEVNKEDNNKCVTFNNNPLIFAPPYPNPTKDRINLEVISTSNTEISVQIISSKGTQSATWKAPINEGSNQLSLDLSNLQGGLYYLKLSIDGQLKTYRFVVNN